MPLGFLKRVLAGLGIYATAKRWYQRIWNRSKYERFRRDLESLSPMIPSGTLVIDVGANQGSLVERYLALGARVVAVEPSGPVAATPSLGRGRPGRSRSRARAGDAAYLLSGHPLDSFRTGASITASMAVMQICSGSKRKWK